jgi:hypothetical protein
MSNTRSRAQTATPDSLRQNLLWSLLFFLLFTVGAWQLFVWFTRPPVVHYDNLQLIQLIRTACSSQRNDYLAGVEKSIQARKDAEHLSDQEWSYLQKILLIAKRGEWQSAEQMAIKLEQAQLNRRRKP